MAAGAFTFFAANLADFNITDILGATVKVALISSSYTIDASSSGHTLFDNGANDATDPSFNEIANGFGYTTGGATVTADVATAITNGFKYSSDNVSWMASGGAIPAWRIALFYVSGSLWGKSSPLIGYFLGDSTPADVSATSDGNPLTLNCPANGWFTTTKA